MTPYISRPAHGPEAWDEAPSEPARGWWALLWGILERAAA